MAKVFISYRREDSGYVAGMLAQRLQDRFGSEAVFLDIDHIPLGVDFRDHIAQAVAQCDVLLALIGDAWIHAASADGQRRMDSPTDFVRLELEAALTRHIPVVPVLVDSARMPTEQELPASLHGLVYRNAAEIRAGRDLQHHLDVLTQGVASLIEVRPVPKADAPAPDLNTANRLPPTGEPPRRKTVAGVEAGPIPTTDHPAPLIEWRPTYAKALLLNALFGCGLLYVDPTARRRWLYPSVILPSALAVLFIVPSSNGPGDPLLFATTGLFVGLSIVLIFVGYVASYVDVVRTCARTRRTAT